MDMAAASMTARWSRVEPGDGVGEVDGEGVEGDGVDGGGIDAESRRRT